jgi:hypothetical protein
MAINNPRAGSGAALTTAIYPVFPGLFQHTLHADNITEKERSMFRISGGFGGIFGDPGYQAPGFVEKALV